MDPFIRSLKLTNLLSFGPDTETLELRPLNVLIGPNSSGKSNFLEALALLRACPHDIAKPIREGGGITEWLWKGGEGTTRKAEIDAVLTAQKTLIPLRHRLVFGAESQRFSLVDEVIENERPEQDWQDDVRFYYRYLNGRPVINIRGDAEGDTSPPSHIGERHLKREDLLQPDCSVLSQFQDPIQYPELTYVRHMYERIRLYREWSFGRYTPPRLPQQTDLPEDFLQEDASNLGLVLNDLEHRPGMHKKLAEQLSGFHEKFERCSVRIHGGTVQVFLHERGLSQPIPATRLSDGTLRFLCLISLLCHPDPPPVICIEEPELGLHPDILPAIAELLVDASQRTQLFVTTHSDILIDCFTETPEAVVVCEKEQGVTTMKRLDRDSLGDWLQEYRLGHLWRSGKIGGNRW